MDINDSEKERNHVLFGRIQILEYEIKSLATGLDKLYLLLDKIQSLEVVNKSNLLSFDAIHKINEDHDIRLENCEKNIQKLEMSIKLYEKLPKFITGILAFVSSLWLLWYSIHQYYDNNQNSYNNNKQQHQNNT